MRTPTVVDSLQHLHEFLGKADLNKIHEELLKCLHSLPIMPDLHKIKNELSTSLHSMNFSSLSGLNIIELLTSCFPKKFSPVSPHSTSWSIKYMILFTCFQFVMYFWIWIMKSSFSFRKCYLFFILNFVNVTLFCFGPRNEILTHKIDSKVVGQCTSNTQLFTRSSNSSTAATVRTISSRKITLLISKFNSLHNYYIV